jgi:hypothetical protein
MRIRQGDIVTYRDVDGKPQQAVCTGHGWHKGMRVVHLDNGQWCYRHDVLTSRRPRGRNLKKES